MITEEKLVAILKHMHEANVTPEQQLSTTAMLLVLDVRKELTRIADALEALRRDVTSQSAQRRPDVPSPGNWPEGGLR